MCFNTVHECEYEEHEGYSSTVFAPVRAVGLKAARQKCSNPEGWTDATKKSGKASGWKNCKIIACSREM